MIPIALTIGGSDSSGGAGIQAGLKTFSALGVYGASVVTALTAQNTLGIDAVEHTPADFIAAQLEAVMRDLAVDAITVGMTGTATAISAIAATLGQSPAPPIVLDPVIVATTGYLLLDEGAESGLIKDLFPLSALITPNAQEAAQLLGCECATDAAAMEAQAERLRGLGAGAVLVTGGDMEGREAVDVLADAEGTVRYAAKRVATANTHGAGCTLSAAITANLAFGLPLRDAVRSAKDFVTASLEHADELDVGKGLGPLNHLHWDRHRAGREK